MRTLARDLFAFDTRETTGDRLFFRVLEVFILYCTISFCWEWGFYIQQIRTVILPLGVAQHVDVSFMFDNGVSLVTAGAATFFCVLGFFRLWSPAYLCALLLFHLQYASRYSLGEISHGSNFIGMSLMAFALAALFYKEGTPRRRFALGFLYFFVGLAYTSAGVSKLIGTGIGWPDGRHLWLWIGERQVDTISKLGAFDPNLLQQFILEDYRLGTLVLGFGLLVELSGVLMWWRRFRYFVIPALIGVHLGIAVSMNIFFGMYIYELLLLGLPWPLLIDRGLQATDSLAARLRYWRFLSA